MGNAPRRPSILERQVRRYVADDVDRLTSGLLLLVLLPVAAVIGVLIFAALGIVLFGSFLLFGQPRALYPVVGIGWFIGSLVILFLVLRRAHRWLTRLIAIAETPARLIDLDDDEELVTAERPATTSGKRLAAIDARLGPDARFTPPRIEPDEDPRPQP